MMMMMMMFNLVNAYGPQEGLDDEARQGSSGMSRQAEERLIIGKGGGSSMAIWGGTTRDMKEYMERLGPGEAESMLRDNLCT